MPDKKDILNRLNGGEGKGISPKRADVLKKLNEGLGKPVEPTEDAVPEQQPISLPMSMQTPLMGITPEQANQNLANSYAWHKEKPNEAGAAIKSEIDANRQYITNDIQKLIAEAPDYAKDQLKSMGIDTGNFVEAITKTDAGKEQLKKYAQGRNALLQVQKEKELSESIVPETPSGLQTERGHTESPEIQKINAQKQEEIEKKYSQQEAQLNSALFNMAALKVVNEEVKNWQGDVEKLNAYEIGDKIQDIIGDQDALKKERSKLAEGVVDPYAKMDRGIIGYRAMQLAAHNALADGDVPVAEKLQQKADNYQRKLIDENPEFRKAQLKEVIADEVYKKKDNWHSWITGTDVTKQDILDFAKENNIPETDVSDINPDDIKRQPNLPANLVGGFGRYVSKLPAAIARHVINPLVGVVAPEYAATENQMNAAMDGDWYDNSSMGRFFQGKAPNAANIIPGGTKVNTDPTSESYLMNMSDDNKKDWNVNIGTVANTLIDGTSQIAGNIVGGGIMGKVASTGPAMGQALYNYVSGYDDSKRQADAAINGTSEQDEINKVGLANVYTLANVLSEQIFPDSKMNAFRTMAGKEFLQEVQSKGFQNIGKSSVVDFAKKAIGETVKEAGKEGLEEFATPYANAIGDMLFSPETFKRSDYNQQAVQQGVLGAMSALVPVTAGAVRYASNAGAMKKSLIYEMGKNPTPVINFINTEASEGEISQQEANEKIKTINTVADIVKNSVPEESIITGQPLGQNDKVAYANNMLEESLLTEAKEKSNDEVQSRLIDDQIKVLQQKREEILSQSKPTENGQTNEAQETEIGQENVLTAPEAAGGADPVMRSTTDAFGFTPEYWNEVAQKEDVSPIQNIEDATTESQGQQQEGSQQSSVGQYAPTEQIGGEASQPATEGSDSNIGSERQQEETVTKPQNALTQPDIVEQAAPTKPTLQFTTSTGNAKVTNESGALRVINNRTGEDVSPQTRRKAIKEAADNYDFFQGDAYDESVVPENMLEQDFGLHVIENSNNPAQIAEIYAMQEPEGQMLNMQEDAIREFGAFTTTNSSYQRFGDRNNMSLGKAKAYINKKGAGIDQIAQEISNASGFEIEPQDIVDFMDRFPNGIAQAERKSPNKISIAAAEKFEALTGFPLTNDIAQIIEEQQLKKIQEENAAEFELYNQIINGEYETRKQVEDEFDRLIREGKIEWSGDSSDFIVPQAQVEESNANGEVQDISSSIGQPGEGASERGPTVNEESALFVDEKGVDVSPLSQLPAQKTPYNAAVAEYNKWNDYVKKKEINMERLEDAGKRNSEEFKKEYAAWKKYHEMREIAEKNLDKEYRQSLKNKAASVRGLKIKPDQDKLVMGVGPIGVALKLSAEIGRQLWNASLEVVALALESGADIKNAIQKGVEYINDRLNTRWDEKAYRDFLGENELIPATADEVRARMDDGSGLGEELRKAADTIVESVSSNENSLSSALDYIKTLPLSQPTKEKLNKYIRSRVNAEIYKGTGKEWADRIIANTNTFDEALEELAKEVDVLLRNAETQEEKANILNKQAGAKTYIQMAKTEQGIRDGDIQPVYSKPQTAGKDGKPVREAPKRRKVDILQENTQDKNARLARIQEAFKDTINKATDALTAIRLKNSKAGYHLEKIEKYLGNKEFVKGSFFDRLKKANVDLQQFGLYLYAKHAPERNAYNAEQRSKLYEAKLYSLNQQIASELAKENGGNPETIQKKQEQIDEILNQQDPRFVLMPDGGSGMTNDQAAEIIKEVEDAGKVGEYEKFAQEFRDNVIDKILQFKLDSGLIDENTYNNLNDFYSDYVPLKVDHEDDKDSEGNTIASSGVNGRELYRSKGAADRTYNERFNPVLQSIVDLQDAVTASENNAAYKTLANLIQANPNPAIWEIVPAQYDVVQDKEGKVMNVNEVPHKGDKTNSIAFFDNGKKNYIILHDEGLKNMIKKPSLGKGKIYKGPITGKDWTLDELIQVPTRMFTTFNTLVNPNFILKNPIVDQQDAYLSLLGNDNKEVVQKFRSYVKKAPKLVWQIWRGDKVTSEWTPWIEDWKKNGGEISFLNQLDTEKQNKQTLKLFDNYGKTFSRSEVNHIAKGLKRFATGLEQMTRVMAYRAAVESGLDKEKAAVVSRNATVDFEKKGVYGNYINAFKAFANAGTQGLSNLIHLAFKGDKKARKKVQAFLGMMVVSGIVETVVNDMFSDCDETTGENCYWEKPDYEKNKNFIIPLKPFGGEGYFDMPIGRAFGWFKALGNNIGAMALGKKKAPEAFMETLRTMADYYNPVGGGAPIEQQLTGNLSPATQILTNKNSLGNPINPEDKGGADHENAFPSTEKGYRMIADEMAEMTGGGKGKEGLIDVSPGSIKWLGQTIGGGLYNFFIQQGLKSGVNAAEGEPVKMKELPLINIFMRESEMAGTKKKYYDLAEDSKTELFDQEKNTELKNVLDRLVESGQITPDQRGRRFNFIQRNQTQLRKRQNPESKGQEDNQGGELAQPIVMPDTQNQ